MIALRSITLYVAVLLGMVSPPVHAADPPVQFSELYELLRTNLLGGATGELNRAAVQGLLDQLQGRVTLGEESAALPAPDTAAGPASVSVFDRAYGYVRLSRVDPASASNFAASCERLLATNRLKGLVIDLRFASGTDYRAALAMAGRFFPDSRPLLDWGQGWNNSTQKNDAISLPVVVLVNRATRGAAEALAGILRHGDVALLIGTNTAGQAGMMKEFTLTTGQRVRVTVAPLKVAGGKELPASGIPPDIRIPVSPEDELAWYQDAYYVSPRQARLANLAAAEANLVGTNRPSRRRINEAELVRMSRDRSDSDREVVPPTSRNAQTTTPATVSDPSLVRALDLLKGLSVVQQFRPN